MPKVTITGKATRKMAKDHKSASPIHTILMLVVVIAVSKV